MSPHRVLACTILLLIALQCALLPISARSTVRGADSPRSKSAPRMNLRPPGMLVAARPASERLSPDFVFPVDASNEGSLGSMPSVLDLHSFGAVGDGVTDDTAAVQKALTTLGSQGGALIVPPGVFLITAPLWINVTASSGASWTLRGYGWSSVLLWSFDGDLLTAPNAGSSSGVTIADLAIWSTPQVKSMGSTAIVLQDSTQGLIDHILIRAVDSSVGTSSGIALAGLADSMTIRDTQLWTIGGIGISIGHGSEVRIEGGRIIGRSLRTDASIGVHVTGNNGGVHIVTTDIIALATAVLLDASVGGVSNREVLLVQATLDSCGQGLVVMDSSYVNIAGVWAASSDFHQIYVGAGQNALLVLNGGTIFNGGAYECPNPSADCNGLTMLSGSLVLNGVEVRNNQGRGLWFPPGNTVQAPSITGCRFSQNGQGLNVSLSEMMFAMNVCQGNGMANFINAGTGVQQSNLNC